MTVEYYQVFEWDMSCHQGQTFRTTFQTVNDDLTPWPLTGYTAKMQIKDAHSSVAHLTLAIGTGLTITPATGEVGIEITAAQSGAFKFKNGVYDLILISGSSTVTPVIKGRFDVGPRVTVN